MQISKGTSMDKNAKKSPKKKNNILMFSSSKFAKGNKSKYSIENTPTLPANELTGKRIIFLGSSVTFGSNSFGESFVHFLEKRDGIIPTLEAVNGTVLVDEQVWCKKSYIERMKSINKNLDVDAFVCQLSTNDASMKKPLGTISEGFEIEEIDTHTIAGAIGYIIAYAKGTWNCPIIFYTGTKYDSKRYGEMVNLLHNIAKKWDIYVLDLWNDKEMNAISKADYKLYMANGIHPTRAGYRDWWTPKFESFLKGILK